MRVPVKRVLSAFAVVVAALVLPAGPALAADDSFEVWSLDRCGSAQFADDEGSALRGGDDHVVIYDHCDDGYYVATRVWVGLYWDVEYNRNGPDGAPVVWDPFTELGGTQNGDHLELEVCLATPVDNDWFDCDYKDVYIDG